jgi:hypothetical protein
VLSWPHRGRFSGVYKGPDDAVIGTEGLVGDQDIGCHVRQQRIGIGQIVHLSWGQQEARGIAECVN